MRDNYEHGYPNFHQFISYLQELDDEIARALAALLTNAINKALLEGKREIGKAGLNSFQSLPIDLAKIPVQPSSLAIPWRAYVVARTGVDRDMTAIGALDSVLATVPTEYAGKLPVSSDLLAPYAGSLIAEVADLIDGASSSLLIVSPYWGIHGIKQIESRLDGTLRKRATATIMTPHKMSNDNVDGCHYCIALLETLGFQVQHRVPGELIDGKRPMVHAKLVVSDRRFAYMGSANLSLNGLNESIEAGVRLRGAAASHLYDWFMGLNSQFFEPSEQG